MRAHASDPPSRRDPCVRHLVAFVGIFEDEHSQAVGTPLLCSGFVLDIRGRWFWLFPGHLQSQINEIEDRGSTLARTYLLTFVEPNDGLFPFSWQTAMPLTVNEDSGEDYGVVQLKDYYVSSLRLSGIVPIPAASVASRNEKAAEYVLLGIHAESSSIESAHDQDFIRVAHVALHMKRSPDEKSSSGFWRMVFDASDDLKSVYVEDKPCSSVMGMSGGPIFGLDRLSEGKVRYRLFGMQSAWLKSRGILKACPVDVLASYLVETCADTL